MTLTLVGAGLRRRDRLGPAHLVAGPAVVVVARADGRLRGAAHRARPASASLDRGVVRQDAAVHRRLARCSGMVLGVLSSCARAWRCSAPLARAGSTASSGAAARVGRALLDRPRRQRRAEDDGHHHRAADRHRPLQVPRRSHAARAVWVVLACHAAMGLGTLVGRLAHREDDGHAHHQAHAGRRLLRRDQRRDHARSRDVLWACRSRPRTPSPARSSASAAAEQLRSAVRWGVAGRIVWAWVLDRSRRRADQRHHLLRGDRAGRKAVAGPGGSRCRREKIPKKALANLLAWRREPSAPSFRTADSR